jgi:hypothetical protein
MHGCDQSAALSPGQNDVGAQDPWPDRPAAMHDAGTGSMGDAHAVIGE